MFKYPSKLVFEREKEKEREMHWLKLSNARAMVDHVNVESSIIRTRHSNEAAQLEVAR